MLRYSFKLGHRLFRIALPIILGAACVFAEGNEKVPAGSSTPVNPYYIWIGLTILILLIIFGGAVVYMFILQRNFLKACVNDHQLTVYSKSPAGVPEGTIRAVISFIIIATSLFLCVLLFFKVAGSNSEFPPALSSLLGAVVGFYFGSRSQTKSKDDSMIDEVKGLKEDRDTTKSNDLLNKIKKGITMSKIAMTVLPADQKKKFEKVLKKLEDGYELVENLSKGGNIAAAVEKGQEVFDLFKKENPARDAFSGALKSFTTVLGGRLPAIVLISTVIGAGVKLIGDKYKMWKIRVINSPITPADLPLTTLDSNVGYTLLISCPVFYRVFKTELDNRDAPFLNEVVVLIHQEDTGAFWEKHKDSFGSMEEFEEGLQEFRRAVLDMDLIPEMNTSPEIFAEAGGFTNAMKSFDRIHKDKDALASLQQLALTVEELQKQGISPSGVFEKVKAEENVK